MQHEGQALSVVMLQRGVSLPRRSAESCAQACFVLAQVRRACFELFHFPTSTGPEAASIAFFPTVFFIESSFYKPASHLAPRHSPLTTLSPPPWPWARKSIKLLVPGGGCSRGELLTQQINALSQPPGRSGCTARPQGGTCSTSH